MIKTVGEWNSLDRHKMSLCENMMIKNINFNRSSITMDHYFPNIENLFIDNSTPLPWIVNQLVNDGRMPSLTKLFVTEDVSNIFISNRVRVFHTGDSKNIPNYISVKDKNNVMYKFGIHIH